MKKFIKGLAIVLLLAFIVGVIVTYAYHYTHSYNLYTIKKDPATQLARSLELTKTSVKNGMLFQDTEMISNTMKQGAMEISMLSETETVTNKLYFQNGAFAASGTLTANGQDQKLYGVWVSKNEIAAEIPSLLGETAYGINLNTLKEDLKKWEMLEDLGISADQLEGYLDTLTSFLAQNSEATDSDWATLLKTKVQIAELLKNSPVTIVDSVILDNGKETKAFRISYMITAQRVCEAVDIMAEWAISTKGYKNACKDNPDMGKTVTDMIAEVKKQLEESNATIICDFYLHTKTEVIMQTDIRVDWIAEDDAGTARAILHLGAVPEQSASYLLDINLNAPNDTKEAITLTYLRDDQQNLPSRKLIYNYKGEEKTLLELQYNTIAKTFALDILDGSVTVSGNCERNGERFTVNVELPMLSKVALTFIEKAEMPKMPQYTNLLKLSKKELEELLGSMSKEEPDLDWSECS